MADTVQRQAALPPEHRTRRGSSRPPGAVVGAFVRRHKLAPYLLLAPALAAIALVLLWPLAQVVIFSFQNYSLPQLTGAEWPLCVLAVNGAGWGIWVASWS